MSNLEAKKIAPATGTTVTLGAAGDTVAVSATALKTNTIKDAGGNTIFTSDGSGTITSINGALKGGLIFISSQTASGSASISFTSGLDSTHNEYWFVFTNINPVTDDIDFTFQCSTDGGSNYNTIMTTTGLMAYNAESGGTPALYYMNHKDQAQGTAYQSLAHDLANDSDAGAAGILQLFNPASTTYVKNFYSRSSMFAYHNYMQDEYYAGYFNTTSALNAISFKMESGNFDGTVAMYGTG